MPRYEFRHANGRTCCSGDLYEALCARCKPLASPPTAAEGRRAPVRAAAARTAAQEPPAPSLIDAIRAAAGDGAKAPNPVVTLTTGTPAGPRAAAHAQVERFPVTVSLIDNIQAAAAARRP